MDWTSEVNAILGQLRPLEEPVLERLEGCTEADIARIEKSFGYRLPGVFVALLKRMGRDPGGLMTGVDFAFPELLGFREVAESLLVDVSNAEGGVLELDERDFVFLMIQGYQFFFFRAGDSDDPAVFFYDDDDPGFREVYESFTEWLDVCMKEELELR